MTTSFVKNYIHKRQLNLQTTVEILKPRLFNALRDAGIAEVTVSYDGEGDSGQISDVTALDESNAQINISLPQRIEMRVVDKVHTYETLSEFIEFFCWELIGLHHDGFENNDGGFGIFTLTVVTEGIQLYRSDRHVERTNMLLEV